MPSGKTRKGESINKSILQALRRSDRPLSTREISFQIKVTWHPVIRHCELLEAHGKIGKIVVGHSNIWFLPEKQSFSAHWRKGSGNARGGKP